jgi:hypothetical protein
VRAVVWVDLLTGMLVHDLRPTAPATDLGDEGGRAYRLQLRLTSSDALIAVHVFG